MHRPALRTRVLLHAVLGALLATAPAALAQEPNRPAPEVVAPSYSCAATFGRHRTVPFETSITFQFNGTARVISRPWSQPRTSGHVLAVRFQ